MFMGKPFLSQKIGFFLGRTRFSEVEDDSCLMGSGLIKIKLKKKKGQNDLVGFEPVTIIYN